MTKILAFNFMVVLLGISIANADTEVCNKEGCLPLQGKNGCLQKCQKDVAERFKQCAMTVTHGGVVKNDADLNRCKEFAKIRKEECKKTCA